MTPLEFIAAMAAALAWPLVVVAIAYGFRRELAALLGRLRSVKAAGAEATFEAVTVREVAEAAKETAETLADAASPTEGALPDDDAADRRRAEASELRHLAATDPAAGIAASWARLEDAIAPRLRTARGLPADAPVQKGQVLVQFAGNYGALGPAGYRALKRLAAQAASARADPRSVSMDEAWTYQELAAAMLTLLESAPMPAPRPS